MKIKYRTWKNAGEYSYMITSPQGVVTAIKNCYDDEGITEGTTGFHYVDIAPKPERFILMQFIGLEDLKGNEIFEGDIVKHSDGENSYIGAVVRDCYQFYIDGIEPNDSYSFDNIADTAECKAAVEVIGNIYENPEFLELNTQLTE